MGKKDSSKAAGKNSAKAASNAAAKSKTAIRVLKKDQSKRAVGTPIDLKTGDGFARTEKEEKGYLRCSARLTSEQLEFWHAAGGSEWTRRLLEEGLRLKAQKSREKSGK